MIPLQFFAKRRFFVASLALGLLAGAAMAEEPATVRYLDRQGKVSVETAGNGTTRDTRFALASIGKTMTAVALLRLVDAGQLTLDDAAADWLPEEIVDGFDGLEGITLRHLLTMTSGLPDYYDEAYLEEALQKPPAARSAAAAVAHAFGEERLFAPGKGYDYSNTNYTLLGLIIEKATGLTYAEAMQREVLGPAGMTRSFVFGSRPLPADFATPPDNEDIRRAYTGPGFGDGGIIATAPDLVRFYRALITDGTLLKPETLKTMLSDPAGNDYGMGIEIEGNIIGHSGSDIGVSTDVRMNRRSGTIAVVLVAEEDAETGWAGEMVGR